MKHSDTIKELAGALLAAQKAIKAAIKDSTNPHFRSKYADLSSVIDAVKQPLNDAGIVFTQAVSGAENAVAVETMLLHTSGEWMSETLIVPVVRMDAQGVGSAITYGRRYGLQSLCGVPAEDDDGNAATAAAPKITPTAGTWESLTDDQRKRLTEIAQVCVEYMADGDHAASIRHIDDAALDADEKTALWTRFDSKQRAGMKKAARESQLSTQA